MSAKSRALKLRQGFHRAGDISKTIQRQLSFRHNKHLLLPELFTMAASSSSANMVKRTILINRLAAQVSNIAEASPRTIRPFAFGSVRSIHNSARLPTITASESRHRPTLRPHQLSVARTGGQPPVGKRTIFIQTESTPNPDV